MRNILPNDQPVPQKCQVHEKQRKTKELLQIKETGQLNVI